MKEQMFRVGYFSGSLGRKWSDGKQAEEFAVPSEVCLSSKQFKTCIILSTVFKAKHFFGSSFFKTRPRDF